jgi:hypothetical protein
MMVRWKMGGGDGRLPPEKLVERFLENRDEIP